MKRSKILAALVIVSLSLITLVPEQSGAQGAYTEKLAVYVAGQNAAWFTTIGGVNVTNSKIISAEATANLNSYNLTAIRTIAWASDFQLFGPQGYKVLPVPFVLPQGAFLTVGTASFTDAKAAAAKFAAYLLTTFKSTSNSTASYTFFGPVSFVTVVQSTLLKLLPLNNGGFLAPVTISKFLGLSSPLVTLSGQRAAGGGFTHQITIGSITASGLDSTGAPAILNYFGQAAASIQASNKSTSSTIEIHFLDGLVVSSDGARINSDRNAFSSSYLLTVKPGARVSKINATVIQQPPELLATRLIDVGVLKPGTNMSVSVLLNNLSNSTVIHGITVNDTWWKTVGGFKLVRGTSDISVPSLSAGQSTSPTYVLQYTGTVTQQVTLPALPVSYTYVVGTTSETARTTINPLTISLGIDQPVVYAYLSPSGPLGNPVGSNQTLKVVVKNVGTRAASSVRVGGTQLGGLPSDGGSATANLFAAASSFTQANVTKSFLVSYITPGGQTLNLTTNSLPIIFSHTGMSVGFATLALNATLSPLPTGTGYSLTLTMDTTNKGSVDVSSFVAKATIPASLPCVKVSSNVTCDGNSLTISYALLKAGGKAHETANFNVTQPSSFILWPAPFSFQSAGYTISGQANAQPVPTGLFVLKQFSPAELFPGMYSRVTAWAQNSGPYNIYNTTIVTAADGFDSVKGNQTTTRTVPALTPASNVSVSYLVTAGSASSNQPVTPAVVRFFMGGTPFTLSSTSSSVHVSQPLSASIVSSPSNPVEGNQFTVTVTITNTAAVGVSDVDFLLPIPSGVAVSSPSNSTLQKGGLDVSVASLGAGSSFSAKATFSANSGQTIPFKGARLTFGYSNQVLNGSVTAGGIAVAENTTTRYYVPIGIALLAVLVVAYEVRRMAASTAPSSQP